MPALATPSADPSAPSSLSAGARAVISVLIFAHLLLVAIALSAYADSSGLQQRLRDRFGSYLKTFNFDVIHPYGASARFHLTHALPTDVDFSMEVETRGNAGSQKTVIPDLGLWPRQRRERYQALANAAGAMAENPELDGVLPKAVAAAVLNARGATQGVVRLRAHYLIPIENMKLGEAKRNPFDASYSSNLYEADVLVSGGTVDLLKRSSAAETAPVEPSGPSP